MPRSIADYPAFELMREQAPTGGYSLRDVQRPYYPERDALDLEKQRLAVQTRLEELRRQSEMARFAAGLGERQRSQDVAEYMTTYRAGHPIPPSLQAGVDRAMGISPTPEQQVRQRQAQTAETLARAKALNAAYDAIHEKQVQAENQRRADQGLPPLAPTIAVQATPDQPLYRVQGRAAIGAGGAMGALGRYGWETSPQGEVRQRQEDVNAARQRLEGVTGGMQDLTQRLVGDMGGRPITQDEFAVYQADAAKMMRAGVPAEQAFKAAQAAREAAGAERERLLAMGPPAVPGVEALPADRRITTTQIAELAGPRTVEMGQGYGQGTPVALADIIKGIASRPMVQAWRQRYAAARRSGDRNWAAQVEAELPNVISDVQERGLYANWLFPDRGAPTEADRQALSAERGGQVVAEEGGAAQALPPMPVGVAAAAPAGRVGAAPVPASPTAPPPPIPWEQMTYEQRADWLRRYQQAEVDRTQKRLAEVVAETGMTPQQAAVPPATPAGGGLSARPMSEAEKTARIAAEGQLEQGKARTAVIGRQAALLGRELAKPTPDEELRTASAVATTIGEPPGLVTLTEPTEWAASAERSDAAVAAALRRAESDDERKRLALQLQATPNYKAIKEWLVKYNAGGEPADEAIARLVPISRRLSWGIAKMAGGGGEDARAAAQTARAWDNLVTRIDSAAETGRVATGLPPPGK
jgi:hypothetical protein